MLQCKFHNFRCALEVGKIVSSSDDTTVSLIKTLLQVSSECCLVKHYKKKTPVRSYKLLLTCSVHQVRVWNTKKMDCTNISSPTVIRKRVTAPKIECSRLVSHERATTSKDVAACTSTSAGGELSTSSHSPLRPRVLEFGTPESAKKRAFSLFQEEASEMRNSPGAQVNSPSSVLSPPPSLKRKTIRDYFASSTS